MKQPCEGKRYSEKLLTLQLLSVRKPPITGPMAYERPAKNENMLKFLEYSFRDTLSAMMTLQMTLIPAHAIPCKARPRMRTGKALRGAAVQRVLPTIINSRTISNAACLPKISAICPQKGIKVAA